VANSSFLLTAPESFMPDGVQGEGQCPLRLWDATKDEGHAEAMSKASIGINTDVPCAFETAAFKGHMLFYVDGLPSSPANLFKGRKRKSHLAIKVRMCPPHTS